MRTRIAPQHNIHVPRQLSLSIVLLLLFAGLITSFGCSSTDKQEKIEKENIVVQIGDSVLTEHDVKSRIPAGITSEDSVMLYDAIVQSWIEKRLLVDVAEVNMPTIKRIDRMVEDYRLQLLTNEYRRVMAEQNAGKVSEGSVLAYYNKHREELRLQQPLVKGVYIKATSRSTHLGDIRKWIASDNPDDIAALERYGLQGAMQYDDFRNTWVSWQSLSELIPYQFGNTAGFLHKGYLFNEEIEGSVYMLHLTDIMPAGEIMPYEFARDEVSRILADRLRAGYDADLLRTLYDRAIKNKTIKPGGYVPAKFRKNITSEQQ